VDEVPFKEIIGGDWIDYVHDLCAVVYRYHPRSLLELGCGAFHGMKAVFAYGTLNHYMGVDRASDLPMLERLRLSFPAISMEYIQKDVNLLTASDVMGDYDCALIDAHAGSARQFGIDHQSQGRIVDELGIPLVIADDCRILEVAAVHLKAWGEPTGKGKGVTGLWWWER
jgi:hypothetical protein